MVERIFGEPDGVAIGAMFADRAALSAAGIHRPIQAGISGSQDEGADSIVVSGGYEDDEDYGDVIIYTGHGGRDEGGRAIADQRFERGNRALAVSCEEGLPVRVVRGAGGDPAFAPASGYRYDGLYSVERFWSEVGRSGFRVWRYRLVRDDVPDATTSQAPPGTSTPIRSQNVVQRVVRSSAVVQWVKDRHEHRCQVCGIRIDTPVGPYAEGAHVRPLGRPHEGPDVAENVLCLCPNDHTRFDLGALVITDAFEVLDSVTNVKIGPLRIVPQHEIGIEYVQYHRAMFEGL